MPLTEDVTSKLNEALADSRLTYHRQYLPPGELDDLPVVLTLQRVSLATYDKLASGSHTYASAVVPEDDEALAVYAEHPLEPGQRIATATSWAKQDLL